jgi:hypothetical protein
MNTEITILELADMINAHLAKGGLVMDASRDDVHSPVTEACLDEWNGREDSALFLRCPELRTGFGSSIPDADRLEVHGHEVHYFSGTDYCGKVVFLNPAPVDLTARADAARGTAYAAYAAAVARCNRAVDARDAAADVARDAAADADAAEAAAEAAAGAYVAAEFEAKAAYAVMVAARNAI